MLRCNKSPDATVMKKMRHKCATHATDIGHFVMKSGALPCLVHALNLGLFRTRRKISIMRNDRSVMISTIIE
jgi:hypothetical protein